VFTAISGAIAWSGHLDFRVLHFSVQQGYLHFIVEADSRLVSGFKIAVPRG